MKLNTKEEALVVKCLEAASDLYINELERLKISTESFNRILNEVVETLTVVDVEK